MTNWFLVEYKNCSVISAYWLAKFIFVHIICLLYAKHYLVSMKFIGSIFSVLKSCKDGNWHLALEFWWRSRCV